METITGSVYFRDDSGNLMLAESFQDEAGVVRTIDTLIDVANESSAQIED